VLIFSLCFSLSIYCDLVIDGIKIVKLNLIWEFRERMQYVIDHIKCVLQYVCMLT